MKSKIEIKLNTILSEKYTVVYEPKKLYGKEFSLKVDFELTDWEGNIIHLEYSGMNFFRKYYKIIDVAKNNSNFYVIYDDENIEYELTKLSENDDLSLITIDKTINRIEKFYQKCKELWNI